MSTTARWHSVSKDGRKVAEARVTEFEPHYKVKVVTFGPDGRIDEVEGAVVSAAGLDEAWAEAVKRAEAHA
jgi:hypothetical protein